MSLKRKQSLDSHDSLHSVSYQPGREYYLITDAAVKPHKRVNLLLCNCEANLDVEMFDAFSEESGEHLSSMNTTSFSTTKTYGTSASGSSLEYSSQENSPTSSRKLHLFLYKTLPE
jgi:hypothetical protein